MGIGWFVVARTNSKRVEYGRPLRSVRHSTHTRPIWPEDKGRRAVAVSRLHRGQWATVPSKRVVRGSAVVDLRRGLAVFGVFTGGLRGLFMDGGFDVGKDEPDKPNHV